MYITPVSSGSSGSGSGSGSGVTTSPPAMYVTVTLFNRTCSVSVATVNVSLEPSSVTTTFDPLALADEPIEFFKAVAYDGELATNLILVILPGAVITIFEDLYKRTGLE